MLGFEEELRHARHPQVGNSPIATICAQFYRIRRRFNADNANGFSRVIHDCILNTWYPSGQSSFQHCWRRKRDRQQTDSYLTWKLRLARHFLLLLPTLGHAFEVLDAVHASHHFTICSDVQFRRQHTSERHCDFKPFFSR